MATWAAGITYTVVNHSFLFDKQDPLCVSVRDITAAFGVGTSTAPAKSHAIREMLRINRFDWCWMVPTKAARYSGRWAITLDGVVVDVHPRPREVHEEAVRDGPITSLPPSTDEL